MVDPNTPSHNSNEDLAAKRVALEREVMDPDTDISRLREIARLNSQEGVGAGLSTTGAYNEDSLRAASAEELNSLLKDKSTPHEALRNILHIIQERDTQEPPKGEPFPPEGE